MADTAGSFRCTLVTPERQVLDEQVTYASIPAWDGQLGVAHLRAPLLAKLGDGPLRLDYTGGQSRWFFLAGGFAQVKDNSLSLVANEAVAAEEINEQDVEAAMREAEARIARTDEEVARKQREVERARTLLRIINPNR